MTRFACCCATQIIIIGSNVLNLYLATNGGADPAGVVRQLVPPSAGTTTHAHVLRRVLSCWCEAVLSHSTCGLCWQCCTTLSTSPHQMSMIGTGTAGSRPSLWLCTSHSKCGTTHGVYLVCQPRLILSLHALLCCPSTDLLVAPPSHICHAAGRTPPSYANTMALMLNSYLSAGHPPCLARHHSTKLTKTLMSCSLVLKRWWCACVCDCVCAEDTETKTHALRVVGQTPFQAPAQSTEQRF